EDVEQVTVLESDASIGNAGARISRVAELVVDQIEPGAGGVQPTDSQVGGPELVPTRSARACWSPPLRYRTAGRT
ncbi:MAG: hypothetical protein P8Y04_12690, partial [Desulfobulbaceae bacterium]